MVDWSFIDFKIALLSNFKTRTDVHDRVFDTLVASLALFLDYNVILKGEKRRYSRFLRLLDVYSGVRKGGFGGQNPQRRLKKK